MEFDEEITPSQSSLKIGPFELSLLPQSVQQSIQVKFTLGVDENRCPDGHVRASVTLKCRPPIRFRKSAHIRIPTWFSSEMDVDVGIFVMQDGMTWKETETTALTDEKFIDVHVKQLSNIAAFLHTRHLRDVSLQVLPYVFCNSSGSFKVGCMPSDGVVRNVLSADMKHKKHASIIKDVKAFSVSVGDEIRYNSCDENMKGKTTIDEVFLQEFRDQVVTYDLKASPYPASFDLQHVRLENGRSDIMHTDVYPVVIQENQAPSVSNVEFLGNLEAENVFNGADDVYIDQRREVDESGKISTKSSRNDVCYGMIGTRTQATPPVDASGIPSITMRSTGAGNRVSNIKFFGDVKVKNVVGNARTITIDQRKTRTQTNPDQRNRSRANDNLPTSVAVQEKGGVAAQDGLPGISDGDQYKSVKNDFESMVGSDRAFNSMPRSKGNTQSDRVDK